MSNAKLANAIDGIICTLHEIAHNARLAGDEKPKTKFLVCRKPKNSYGGGARYRIRDNPAVCQIEAYSSPHSDGIYIAQADSHDDPRVYVLDCELVGLRDLLTHLIAKRGVK